MARVKQQVKQEMNFVSKKNILLFLVGLVTIAVAFVLMAQPPVDGFLSRTLAPIVLLIAYLIIIPAAILVRDKSENHKA